MCSPFVFLTFAFVNIKGVVQCTNLSKNLGHVHPEIFGPKSFVQGKNMANPARPIEDEVEEGDPELVSLDGLAKIWNDTEVLRDLLLGKGTLLLWPDDKLTGAVNFNTIAYNGKLIELVLQLWCPQVSEAKTLIIDQVRAEVGRVKTNKLHFCKCFPKRCYGFVILIGFVLAPKGGKGPYKASLAK